MNEPTAPSRPVRLKRGRPKPEAVAQMEEAVLATALQLFLDGGVDAVSMERVALMAGISRTTLYKRYATSAELVDAMVQRTIATWYERTSDVPSIVSDDIEALLQDRLAVIANILIDPVFAALQRFLLTTSGRFPHLASTMHEYGYQDAIRLLASDIRTVSARIGQPVTCPENVAEHIITSVHGWHIQHAMVRNLEAEDIQTYGKSVIKLLLAARDQW